ncbi:phosphate/phosphite/phosphonate ABC transporter substrate-binding protein [Anabaena cylindrica FACHB-243]|uniref:Phosphonate ABC transporter, periplasmic phosphonate-binding protein n=1 Tax=Anabaena cylindrica (strain ATCC 27899 / PCC 7122) TaxID=272123 RepID=K9ZL82_ANACC|nr:MULTISPECIES: phosphate/phosphite/phosphonate ABC transporter substrate-binding protein [Anabaena]AFZ59090.1 phosphonate ABC transporter, periplasmic phosphonate-binding protein [Anabaena cylindrica PCC 7122]MBD2420571.1 phosphate/phosphite/phosphonate ABC transporter substrate-binding protein [Anabaena cylindrica FACHB-243]MBY5284436.1 phosphate/phosphite/phosphonate ABC transporter substrate-binding protein [Anabaena sp. CCAP 1446/1C]MBY5308999.1 phosphate/phosphite/phosphonate ABC transpo
MKRRKLIWYSLLFTVGCASGINTADDTPDQLAVTAPKKLRFAVTDVTGLEDLQRDFGAFRTALSEVLGIPIEFFPVDNPTAAAPALLSGEVDIVFAGPSEYLVLNARAKAIPVVAIKRINYHSIILVRANSPIKSVSQLKGKTIAMRSIGSTSGHLSPMKLLIDAGLDPNTDFKIVMLNDKGIVALKKGEVDAWAVASDRYQNILASEGLSEQDFSIIVTGPLLPSDVFVVSNQMAADFVETVRSRMMANQDKLIQSLLVAPANQKYQGGQLVRTDDSEYNMIREVYQKLGQGNFLQ